MVDVRHLSFVFSTLVSVFVCGVCQRLQENDGIEGGMFGHHFLSFLARLMVARLERGSKQTFMGEAG
jgi:hypothetical protein